MIVIGSLIDTERRQFDTSQLMVSEDQETPEDDEESTFIDIDFCRIQIRKLVALNQQELTVYSYNE